MMGVARHVASASRRWLEYSSLALIAIAVAWWAIVYAQVMLNTDFPLDRSLPCMLYTSDRCSLAQALCKGWHFLGIQRYSAELLWIGALFAVAGLLAGGIADRSAASSRRDA